VRRERGIGKIGRKSSSCLALNMLLPFSSFRTRRPGANDSNEWYYPQKSDATEFQADFLSSLRNTSGTHPVVVVEKQAWRVDFFRTPGLQWVQTETSYAETDTAGNTQQWEWDVRERTERMSRPHRSHYSPLVTCLELPHSKPEPFHVFHSIHRSRRGAFDHEHSLL